MIRLRYFVCVILTTKLKFRSVKAKLIFVQQNGSVSLNVVEIVYLMDVESIRANHVESALWQLRIIKIHVFRKQARCTLCHEKFIIKKMRMLFSFCSNDKTCKTSFNAIFRSKKCHHMQNVTYLANSLRHQFGRCSQHEMQLILHNSNYHR